MVESTQDSTEILQERILELLENLPSEAILTAHPNERIQTAQRLVELMSKGRFLAKAPRVMANLQLTNSSTVAEKLGNLLELEDLTLIKSVIDSLGALGAGAVSMAPKLCALLNHQNTEIRCSVAKTLGAIGPKAQGAVPALIECLDEDTREVKIEVIRALGRIGRGANTAVTKLLSLLGSPDVLLKNHAAEAIGSIGGEEASKAVPELERMLEGSYLEQFSALRTLISLGSEGVDAAPRLLGLLEKTGEQEGEASLRPYILRALGRMGPGVLAKVPNAAAILRALGNDPESEATLEKITSRR